MNRFIFGFLAIGLLLGAGFLVLQMTETSEVYSAHASEDIVDPPVQKCVNMGGALEAPNEGDWGYTIRETDFRLISALGFDTVRVPIKWSAHTDARAPYKINERFFQRIDTVVQQALDSDLQVIINVHHYDAISEDAEAHTPRLRAIWQQISDRYVGWSDRLMFEFLNEPHTSVTARKIDELNRMLLADVRTQHPDRWIVLGGGQWGTLDGLTETNPPNDPHAMVTFHFYDPFEFTHQGAPWAHKQVPLGQTWGTAADRRDIAETLTRAARWRDRTGRPLLLGEFGVYTDVPDADRAVWTEYVRRTSESLGFGWCYWDWSTSLGMYDQPSESVRPGMGTALLSE
ncbi:MAG: glycoside hydrolase [Ponticaulis sp.]|nr:glycoside hydrolase [Ponticaulis sp.]|tara:strand:- start:16328 stop:17359 length:1032 start_codon:yes stop_codon:yes gene_type:complete